MSPRHPGRDVTSSWTIQAGSPRQVPSRTSITASRLTSPNQPEVDRSSSWSNPTGRPCQDTSWTHNPMPGNEDPSQTHTATQTQRCDTIVLHHTGLVQVMNSTHIFPPSHQEAHPDTRVTGGTQEHTNSNRPTRNAARTPSELTKLKTKPICRLRPLDAVLPSGLCGKERALPPVTGLTVQRIICC